MANQQFFAQTFSSEFDRFHNVVAALPGENLEYRHDPKSRSARELVAHLIGHFDDLAELLDAGEIHHRIEVPFNGIDDAVTKLDRSFREVEGRLKAVTDGAWAKPGDFFVGERSIMKTPAQALAWMLFLDAVHHRGQLSTLIRPMGGKVPGIYGPSADTQMVG